ncbi:MAG: hypothetical protein ABWY29_09840 [Blastococcus sp.]
MVTYGSADAEGPLRHGTAEPVFGGGTRVEDDAVVALPPLPPRRNVLGSPASVEEQLRRLESRLLAEAGGDPAVERDVRRHLAESCARFETARVRLFVPILVERAVRHRLGEQGTR